MYTIVVVPSAPPPPCVAVVVVVVVRSRRRLGAWENWDCRCCVVERAEPEEGPRLMGGALLLVMAGARPDDEGKEEEASRAQSASAASARARRSRYLRGILHLFFWGE
jgi:hypothetical protein